jgi:hypothetical protein
MEADWGLERMCQVAKCAIFNQFFRFCTEIASAEACPVLSKSTLARINNPSVRLLQCLKHPALPFLN